jgi:prevent-host-death family protein
MLLLGLNKKEEQMKQIPLSEVKNDLSEYLRLAEEEAIFITRHGKPAGILIGFASEDEWFENRLEHDPRFLKRIEAARANLQTKHGTCLEDVPE